MAINSPFKKLHHSRESSRDEQQKSNHNRPTSLSNANSVPKQALKKSNTVTSTKSSGSINSAALSQQFEADRVRLIKYCFSSYDSDGVLKDSYISHVRVIEDSAYPFSKPPSNSPSSNKKNRVLVLAVKKDGEVFLHKGRENDNGSFQIGRSWSLGELSLLSREIYSDTGFLAKLGKDYYWETNTPRERHVFVTTLVRVYRKFKNGLVPQLTNWDLSIFGLDVETYKTFVNREVPEHRDSVSSDRKQSVASERKASVVSTPADKPSRAPLKPIPQDSLKKTKESTSTSSFKTIPTQNSQSSLPTAVAATTAAATDIISTPSPRQIDIKPRNASSPKKSEIPERRQSDANNAFPSNENPLRRPSNISSEDPLGNSTEVDVEQNELEDEITQKINELNLDHDNIPRRGDISTGSQPDLQSSTEISELGRISSTVSTGLRSVKDIEIVAQRKSLAEYQQEDEDDDDDEDDIADLYKDTSSEHSSSAQKSTTKEEYSFNSQEESYEKITVTPATIKANTQSDDEYDDLNEDVVPDVLETPRLNVRKSPVRRDRANTINSALDTTIHDSTTNSSFDEIFDTIDWDENDDADTLTFKLMKELADTQYETVKQLIEVKERSSGLQSYTKDIISECDKISPLLNLFSVELSGFVSNVQHIENEGRGLQVETLNKKNLWKDLQTILETVSVDDNSLKFLLNSDIDQNIESIETILSDLQSAMVAIRGRDKDEEDLGDMRALRERRRSYESVMIKFLQKLVKDLDQRFRYIFQELIKSGELDESNIRRSLSRLMVYSALTLFTKDISEESFDELIGTWEGSANNFSQVILTNLNNDLVKSINNVNKFSLDSTTAFKNDVDVSPIKRQAEIRDDRLKARLGLSDDHSTANKPQATDKENKPIHSIFEALNSLQNHVILQQDFLLKFFHVSRDDLSVSKFIKSYPLHERISLLDSSVNEIEADLGNAREIYNSLSMIFQPTLEVLIKNLVQSLRNNQINTPIVILYLELFESNFGSSNQEFLLVTYKKFSDRLKVDWLRFVDIEVKTIEKTTLAPKKIREVSIFIKNFTRAVKEIESNYSETLLKYGKSNSALESRELINSSYEQLSRAIIKNLNSQEEDRPSRFNIHDDSEDREKKNHLINLIQNSNWLIETLLPLKLQVFSSTIAASRDIFTSSKDRYILSVQNGSFAKIATFVNDVEGLIKETAPKNVDPSKRNAYSKTVLTKILSGIDTKEINKIVNGIREDVVKSFISSSDSSEIQHQLIEKIWSAIQAQFVSTSLGLENIVTRYYRDVDVRFSKKEIIAAFNTARLN